MVRGIVPKCHFFSRRILIWFICLIQREKSCLSRIGTKLKAADLRLERMDIDASIALKMFEDNK